MATLLFTTLPTNDLGLLARSLPIASELANRGHDIQFCSPAPAPSRLVAEAGFQNRLPSHPLFDLLGVGTPFAGLARLLRTGRWRLRHRSLLRYLAQLVSAMPIRSAPRTTQVWDVDHAAALMGMLNGGFVRANVEAYRDLIKETGADAVVNFWNPFATIAARITGKPLVSIIQSDAHPGSGGFIWWKSKPPGVPNPVSVVNQVLSHLGQSRISSVADLSLGDLTLVVGMPETDPLPDGSNAEHVGALLWQPHDAKLPDWFAMREPSRPLVWVYAGNPTYGPGQQWLDSAVVLSAAVEALAEEPLDVVLTAGHHRLPAGLLPLPANFQQFPYAPGLLLAEASDVLVHHGGYGSCQTGAYAGKPAVVIPTFSERESNARRLAATGAATLVPMQSRAGRKRVDATALRSAVRRMLVDPEAVACARRLQKRLREFGGARTAAHRIECLIGSDLNRQQYSR